MTHLSSRNLLLVSIASLILVSCGQQMPTENDGDQAMRDHCRMMPEMKGCEKFISDSSGMDPRVKPEDDGLTSHMMDHSSMVTSEEAFVINMIPHHQEAVDTARLVVAKGESPELKKLAQAIVTAQEREISMMQQWSTDWGYTSVKSSYENMMGDGTSLSGKELDNWFLQGMIMHHMGALQMAEAVQKLKPRAEIADFARGIIKNQSAEIKEMKSMLGMNSMMHN